MLPRARYSCRVTILNSQLWSLETQQTVSLMAPLSTMASCSAAAEEIGGKRPLRSQVVCAPAAAPLLMAQTRHATAAHLAGAATRARAGHACQTQAPAVMPAAGSAATRPSAGLAPAPAAQTPRATARTLAARTRPTAQRAALVTGGCGCACVWTCVPGGVWGAAESV